MFSPSTQNWTRVETPLIPETVNMEADEDVQQNLVLTSEILALECGWKSAAAGAHDLVLVEVDGRRRRWHPTPVLLPGKSHGQRSLVGCNPWGCKESDTTE